MADINIMASQEIDPDAILHQCYNQQSKVELQSIREKHLWAGEAKHNFLSLSPTEHVPRIPVIATR